MADWSLKQEFDIVSSALTTEKVPYPPVRHDRISRIQQAINRNININIDQIDAPPFFSDNVLTRDNWTIASDYYEETLDTILTLSDGQRADEITKLEAWFITLISPPPKNRSDAMVDLWRRRELSKLDNNHTSNCPVDYQAYVKQNIDKYLSPSWKDNFRASFDHANKSVTRFQYVRVVRLSEILK